MDKPYYRYFFEPQLETPILVEGLPGFGNVGKIAAQFLIEFTHAKIFAELYSPFFPDYVIVNKNGTCRPPHYEFHVASAEGRQFIILTGDSQPSLEDLLAHYDLCDEILDFAEKYGCKFVATMGGVPAPKSEGEVYVAATSNKLALKSVDKGALIYGKGRIMGATGLLLGLAKKRGWKGICLLGATTGITADKETARQVFDLLLRTLEMDAREGPKTTKGKR